MRSDRPVTPTANEWARRTVDITAEIHAGKQSRVFDAFVKGQRAVVKLTESSLSDLRVLTARMEANEMLGASTANVVTPSRLDGELVQSIGDWFMTVSPFVEGHHLDDGDTTDAHRLGAALADLHHAMRRLDRFDIPSVAALRSVAPAMDNTGWQLLHGDFSTQNVIAAPDMLNVIDFDDCGYGPIEYDVANSIYMVLFDATVTKQPARSEAFRPAFLAGYNEAWAGPVAADLVDEMIARRIEALARWIADPSNAPIGIRRSSPEWLATLEAFVRLHRPA